MSKGSAARLSLFDWNLKYDTNDTLVNIGEMI